MTSSILAIVRSEWTPY